MKSKIKVIIDSPKLANYINQANEMISKYIREKLMEYHQDRGEYLMKKQIIFAKNLKEKNAKMKYFNILVKDKFSSILLNLHHQAQNQLRTDLSNVDFYKRNYQKIDSIKFHIFEDFSTEVKKNGKEIVENCKKELEETNNDDISLLNEIFTEIEQKSQTEEFITAIFDEMNEMINKNIEIEFNEAREKLADVDIQKRKEEKKILFFIPIVETYIRMIKVYPDGETYDSGYVKTKWTYNIPNPLSHSLITWNNDK